MSGRADDVEAAFGTPLPADNDSVHLVSGSGEPGASKPSGCSHPVAAFFMLFFRVGALLFYLLSPSDRFVFSFVMVVLFLAFDFWTVKNISGRLLVGLRWWNEVDENGESKWVFESRDTPVPVNPADSRTFWGALYVSPLIWLIILIFNILSPSKLLICVVALVLNGANMIGYMRCEKDSRKKLQGLATGAAGWIFKQTMQQQMNNATASASQSTSQQQQQQQQQQQPPPYDQQQAHLQTF